MDDYVSIPISLPLDSDGFLRRECPNCEREFKWFAHGEGDADSESVEQYFCPICGAAAGTDAWWTPAQLEYGAGAAGPALDQHVGDALKDALRGVKGLSYKPNQHFTLGLETPEPLHEPDDMMIVEPPCHPHEPIKVPEDAPQPLHCLICGEPFAL